MTRAQAYAEGFQEGRRWAEDDVRNGGGRVNYRSTSDQLDGWYRALELGWMRGYRDTWARWDAGTLTAQMLELAPVNR